MKTTWAGFYHQVFDQNRQIANDFPNKIAKRSANLIIIIAQLKLHGMKWMKHLLDNMLQEKQHSHYMHQSGYWFIELKVSWSFILPPQSTKVQFECRFAFIMCELAIRAESLQSCVNRYTQCVCVCTNDVYFLDNKTDKIHASKCNEITLDTISQGLKESTNNIPYRYLECP